MRSGQHDFHVSDTVGVGRHEGGDHDKDQENASA